MHQLRQPLGQCGAHACLCARLVYIPRRRRLQERRAGGLAARGLDRLPDQGGGLCAAQVRTCSCAVRGCAPPRVGSIAALARPDSGIVLKRCVRTTSHLACRHARRVCAVRSKLKALSALGSQLLVLSQPSPDRYAEFEKAGIKPPHAIFELHHELLDRVRQSGWSAAEIVEAQKVEEIYGLDCKQAQVRCAAPSGPSGWGSPVLLRAHGTHAYPGGTTMSRRRSACAQIHALA